MEAGGGSCGGQFTDPSCTRHSYYPRSVEQRIIQAGNPQVTNSMAPHMGWYCDRSMQPKVTDMETTIC